MPGDLGLLQKPGHLRAVQNSPAGTRAHVYSAPRWVTAQAGSRQQCWKGDIATGTATSACGEVRGIGIPFRLCLGIGNREIGQESVPALRSLQFFLLPQRCILLVQIQQVLLDLSQSHTAV